MTTFLFKWLLWFGLFAGSIIGSHHPIFMSVTEIEHNATDKSLEISCKIFTDDFEKTLRKNHTGTVDLTNPKDRPAMDKLISKYVAEHLRIAVNGKMVILKYLGYEIIEEGVMSYYQADNVPAPKKNRNKQ
jgi:hypothetical protein